MKLPFDERDRESLLRDLVDADGDVRRLAVERLALLPEAEAVPRMVERLGDSSWRVRKAAVSRLVASSDTARVADALIGALADGENPGRRNAAVEALVACRSRVVGRLLEALSSDEVDVRKLVVDALAGIGDDRATETLVRTLEDPDPNVRGAAADALGAVGGDGVDDALRARVRDAGEDSLVRFSALRALAAREVAMRTRDLETVLGDSVLRPAALALLGLDAEDGEAVPVLCKALASSARSTREAAMRAILDRLARSDGAPAAALVESVREAAKAAPELMPASVARLAEADLPSRLVLVQFLGLLGDARAAVPILAAARDEALERVALTTLETLADPAERAIDSAWDRLAAEDRRHACRLFGQTRGEVGERRLLAALEAPDPELRVAAATSIGARGVLRAAPALVARLDRAGEDDDLAGDEEPRALTEALIAIAQGVPKGGCDPAADVIGCLEARLPGASEGERLAIARVLGKVGRQVDAERLALLQKDPSAPVRRAAVEALARLDPEVAAEPLRLALADESPGVRIAAADALGAATGQEGISELRALADDADPRVRAAAVRAAGRKLECCGGEPSRSATLGILHAGLDDEAPVALAAAAALRAAGGVAAAPVAALLSRIEPELILEAVRCVGAHAAAADLDPLIGLVSHADWSVRAEAIQVLAERRVARLVPPILRRLKTEEDEFVRAAILSALKRLEG